MNTAGKFAPDCPELARRAAQALPAPSRPCCVRRRGCTGCVEAASRVSWPVVDSGLFYSA